MIKYNIIYTKKADTQIQKIISQIDTDFGIDTALDKFNDLIKKIHLLKNNPYLGH